MYKYKSIIECACGHSMSEGRLHQKCSMR